MFGTPVLKNEDQMASPSKFWTDAADICRSYVFFSSEIIDVALSVEINFSSLECILSVSAITHPIAVFNARGALIDPFFVVWGLTVSMLSVPTMMQKEVSLNVLTWLCF